MMVKDLCNRCDRPVYPTDKVGPLKDSAFFHHGCFKCYICGTRLALKTYCNNRNNINDREVYCNNHVPNANPHDLPAAFTRALNATKGKSGRPIVDYSVPHSYNSNGTLKDDHGPQMAQQPQHPVAANNGVVVASLFQNGDNDSAHISTQNYQHRPNKPLNAGLQDLKIAHAMKAQKVVKPYPKIRHEGAKYVVDYDAQTRLELMHRRDEDDLYKRFIEARQREMNEFERETQEEWERALSKFAQKYDQQGLATQKQKGILIRQLTIKRDKKLETITSKRRERERYQTAELVDQQAKEMLELFRQARDEEQEHKKIDNNDVYKNSDDGVNEVKQKAGLSSYDDDYSGCAENDEDTDYKLTKNSGNGGRSIAIHRVYPSSIHTASSLVSHNTMATTSSWYGVWANCAANSNECLSRAVARSSNILEGRLPVTSSYPSTPPPPLPPSCSKRHVYTDTSVFAYIDRIAVNVAQSEVTTFTDLIRALTAGASSDVDKARAIFKWITVKNLNIMVFDSRVDKNTPMGLLRGIKNGTESYHVLFKRLCSYAGLHCVVIKGYSKSAGYQPGIKFEYGRFRNTWNAVFLDGSWRFVQCNWGARHMVTAKESLSECEKNASSSVFFYESVHQNNKCVCAGANLRYEYDDHYFMTDPEEFIYEFFPQESEWQLLPRPITLRQFEQLPFVRSLFFRYGLRFVDPKLPAVLHPDKNGAVTVSITSSTSATDSVSATNRDLAVLLNGDGTSVFDNFIFHYNLRYYDEETVVGSCPTSTRNGDGLINIEEDCWRPSKNDSAEILSSLQLKRFVMQSVVDGGDGCTPEAAIVFRVHTPTTRPLLLDIFCNAVSADHYLTGQPIKFKSVCKFKVVCEDLNVIMVPLPECASGEWGPAKARRLFGLMPLTHPDAIVNCSQYCEIRFRMMKPLAEFVVTMHRNGVDSHHLQQCCRTSTTSANGETLCIIIEFPDEGQYGLDIYTRDTTHRFVDGKQLLTHCCKYLINARFA